MSKTEHRPIWRWLLALWALLMLLALFRPLAVPDEGRYAEVGRWMLQSGDWLIPRLNGIPFFHKPPLLYWLEGGLLGLLGVQVWVVRLVPALHAGLMLGMLYLAARRLVGEGPARRAALVLGSSLAFLIGGQYVNHDTMVAAWIGVAIWSFALAFLHPGGVHAGWARLGFVACGLGVLSKGLIGLALPGLVLLVWLLATRQFAKVWRLPWFSGLPLFLLIAVPWFVLAEARYPGMLDYLFGQQQVTRFTASTFNNVRPWWFYLLAIAVLLFPWSLSWPMLGWVRWRTRGPAAVPAASADAAALARPVWLLCWVWLVCILGFFSIPSSKLVGYALPVMPPLALLTALGWERLRDAWPRGAWAYGGLLGLGCAAAVGVNVWASGHTQRDSSQDVAQALACRLQAGDTVFAVRDYPFELPFLAQTTEPLRVVLDWAFLPTSDNWRREMTEGARFDARAADVLDDVAALDAAATEPHAWMLVPNDSTPHPDYALVMRGRAWSLYRSQPDGVLLGGGDAGPAAPERPVAAQHKSLPGCQHQGQS